MGTDSGRVSETRALRLSVPPTSGAKAVVGVSGNAPTVSGYMDTGEYLRKLDGIAGRTIFDEMRRSDPQVKAVSNAIALPIRQNPYTIEPASEDARDVEIANTIERGLMEEMSITWDDTVRHALLMFPFGFSVLEKVWELRDGLVMPKKLDPRLPQSIVRWELGADGGLVNIVQRDNSGKEYFLPIEKCLVFTNEKEGDNWEGQSVLRAAYKAWFVKNNLEKINAIKHDRHGVGIPKAKVPAGIDRASEEWRQTEESLRRLYANEEAYVMEPEGYEVSLLGGGGSEGGTDALPSIKYYDEMIAKAVLAMFINLGTSETGSRALGGSFIDVFLMSLQASADYVAQVLTRYLVREWVDYNWTVDAYPIVKAAKIRTLDPTVLKTLVDAKIIKPDAVLEAAVRSQLHLPDAVEAEEVEEPVVEDTGDDEPVAEESDDETVEEPTVDETQDDMEAHAHDHGRMTLADRAPTAEEQTVDYVGYGLQLSDASATLTDRILGMRTAQAQDIVNQLVAGRRPQDIRVVLKKEMYEALRKEFDRQFSVGRAQVQDEVRRQRSTLAVSKKQSRPKKVVDLYDEQLQLWVEGAGDKLKTTLASASLSAKKAGAVGESLRVALETEAAEMSMATWEAMASGAVNGGWGTGRQSGFDDVSEDVEYCYYSAILDGNACDFCHSRDGKHHDVNDPDYLTPNPDCAGTEARCRCMTIAVMKAESEGV
jgi:hypothetical protein